MPRFRHCASALLLAIVTGLLGATASHATSSAGYGALPLSFEANQGQTHSSVAFVARSTGYQLYLTPTEAVMVLRRPGGPLADALRMRLLGAGTASPRGIDPKPGA